MNIFIIFELKLISEDSRFHWYFRNFCVISIVYILNLIEQRLIIEIFEILLNK